VTLPQLASPEALAALRLVPAVEEALEAADMVVTSSSARGTTLPAFVLRHHGRIPRIMALIGRTVPAFPGLLAPGRGIGPFTTIESDPDYYWLGESASALRTRYAAVVADQGTEGEPLFHCAEILHFHHWSMPLYHMAASPMRRLAGQILHRH